MTNKKSLKSQLVGAVAMLLVATMALGGATFAWFTNNKIATAKGMTVNATADSSLVIMGKTNSKDTTYTSVGTNVLEVTTMKPSSSFDGTNFAKLKSTVKVESASSSAATWTGTSGAFSASDVEAASAGTYFVESKYSIKSLGADRNVSVSSLTLTGGKATGEVLNKALRASITLVKAGESNKDVVTVYDLSNLGGSTATTTNVVKKTDSSYELANKTYDLTGDTVLAKLTKDTAYDVIVRIWFEGQDANCYTDAVQTSNYTVEVAFSGADVKPT